MSRKDDAQHRHNRCRSPSPCDARSREENQTVKLEPSSSQGKDSPRSATSARHDDAGRVKRRGRVKYEATVVSKSEGDENTQSWGRHDDGAAKKEPPDGGSNEEKEDPTEEPEQPNFEPSGLLAMETNVQHGVFCKYTVPVEASRADKKWRLLMYKKGSEKEDEVIHIYKRGYYLFGKDNRVVDILLLHESISRQHAVIQYRTVKGESKPCLMDLESTNGTCLNNDKIETARYYELKPLDIIRLGKSTREYLLMHDQMEEVVKGEQMNYGKYLNEYYLVADKGVEEKTKNEDSKDGSEAVDAGGADIDEKDVPSPSSSSRSRSGSESDDQEGGGARAGAGV